MRFLLTVYVMLFNYRGLPCAKMRRIMWYLIWCIVIATILSLNNLVLLYIQHSGSSQGVSDVAVKLPTTRERFSKCSQTDDNICCVVGLAVTTISTSIKENMAARITVRVFSEQTPSLSWDWDGKENTLWQQMKSMMFDYSTDCQNYSLNRSKSIPGSCRFTFLE